MNTMHTNLATLAIILMTGTCFAADEVTTLDRGKTATGDSYPSEKLFQSISIPVLLIPNCDHFVFVKRAASINQIILEFLEGEV